MLNHAKRHTIHVLTLTLTLVLLTSVVNADNAWQQLERAEAARDRFQLEMALDHYQQSLGSEASPMAERSYTAYLIALGWYDQAEEVLEQAMRSHADDPVLLEHRAVLAVVRGQHSTAVAWLDRAWKAGRDQLAWLDHGRLRELAGQLPYQSLVDSKALIASLDSVPQEVRIDRLRLLADVINPEAAPSLMELLSSMDSPAEIRLGIRALRRLNSDLPALLARLLQAPSPRLRRQVLLEIWRSRDDRHLIALEQALDREPDPGNFDLTEVLIAVLQARRQELAAAKELLVQVPQVNAFRHLALFELAGRLAESGAQDHAAAVTRQAQALRPAVKSAAKDAERPLLSYWECQDRTDQQEIRALLEHHRMVEPVDATVYGLPEHDFDDQKLLTIPERLFLRDLAKTQGMELATAGPLQYPREIRHYLRKVNAETGATIDCSGLLAGLETPLQELIEDGSEVKLEEDSAADNEVNIVVNPYDQRYVVATSNPTGSGGNKVFHSSDWGKTWTRTTANVADNCCDPVSGYSRTDVGGVPTDVLYHSTLVGGFDVNSRMIYSTDNGLTWSDCGVNIGAGSRDRQDHAIDSNPASACYNTIYVGHHNGAQFVAASTGASFPYCQSWKEVSTGVGDTIGSAIVISSNGVAHNIFTQYDSPGGVYMISTSSCGSSWSAAQRLFAINNPGTFEWGIPSTCDRQVYRYPQADADRHTASAFLNNIYIVWNDLSSGCTAPGCNGNTTCNNDVYFAVGTPNDRSNPSSWTWTSGNLTNALSDDYTDEFYPSLTVDQADGSIYVSYYRSNSGAPGGAANIGPRKTEVHYVMVKSIDGGQTWEGPLQITDLPTDESGSGANSAMQWGDYVWNDVINGVAYGAWTDRREQADEDVWAAKICSPPTHWSERGPSFSSPPTTASSTGGTSYTVSWSAPDIYWGDGGESPSQRKYQLWVDGALAEDAIDRSATSTTWTAPDTNQHTLFVRAINQCGVSKDYASTTVGSGGGGGGGNTAPQVTISSPASGSSFAEGDSISFTGTADDIEDGSMTADLAWSSSIDGSLGSGGSVTTTLTAGTHTVTASVTDSGGLTGSQSITVTVTASCTGDGFDEDFEVSAGAWFTSGLWHLARSSSCASPGYASPDSAMYYGQDTDCDYATGSRTSGDLISPEISGITSESTLSFSYLREVENEPAFEVDKTTVAAQIVGTTTWTNLWSRSSTDPSQASWTTSGAISLAAFAGETIRFRFRFDSDDDFANRFTGWLIDDVAVTGTGCGSGAAEIFADGFEAGNLSAWSSVVSQ
jgi:tetratricopeptide (TPR) repeat protein